MIFAAGAPAVPVYVAIIVAVIGMIGGVTAAALTFFSARRNTKEVSRVADTKTVVEGLSGLVDQLQEEVKSARAQAVENEQHLHEAQAEIRELRRKLIDRDTEVDNLRAQVAGLAGQVEALKMQKGLS